MLTRSINNILNNELKIIDIITCLSAREDQADELFIAADKTRKRYVGDDIHLRALIEIGNYCRCDCLYCGIRASRNNIKRYRLKIEEIIGLGSMAYSLGYRSAVLQGGEDPTFTKEIVGDIIRGIKINDIAVTLSIGERSKDEYVYWKKCGADRYLLRIETTDDELYYNLHPNGNLEQRKNNIYLLKKLGYQLGSGIMTGLPGQTIKMVAKDVLWLKNEANAEMLGIGPFIPHHDTPLKDAFGGTLFQALKLIAVLRLVFKSAHIPATTALGALAADGREQALSAGANVVMPNITPLSNRQQYEIYPGKLYNIDDAEKDRDRLEALALKLGRKISLERGDTI